MGNLIHIFVLTFCLIFVGISVSKGQSETDSENAKEKYLVIRTDDAGMSHSVNLGLKKLLATDYPVSVSVMFACPWYQESVDILKEHQDQVSIGVHLTLNSEWQHYRWGPVTGREAVPSLVDENGYFFHSAVDLYENNPNMDQLEKELRAQIERALATDLNIEYVDYHMGTAVNNPEFRKVTEKVAKEYDLAMWGYFGENRWDPHYRAKPEDKADSLAAMVPKLKPGFNYLVTHVGLNNEELGAMKDMNTGQPLANMAENRQGELDGLRSKKFQKALQKHDVKLITFGELIEMKGMDSMQRPAPEE